MCLLQLGRQRGWQVGGLVGKERRVRVRWKRGMAVEEHGEEEEEERGRGVIWVSGC